uniref:nucleosome assembly protein 1;1-like n=1 Tax=Fragaria vesca subsp. vesca TaxID=101020 RepID=UPI0005C895F7
LFCILQSQHDELEKMFFEERAALEAKYQKLYEPLYTKVLYEIVNGVTEVEEYTEKGVPDFWLTAMKTNEVLSEEISERDEGALKYLQDIKWSKIDEPKGFKLEFFFNANPYFKNSVLTKTYHMIDDDEPILEKAIGTEIDWYPGKSLTQKILKKKPRKGSKNVKPITKTEDCESFFNFFNLPKIPDTDDGFDEETAEELQSQIEKDYDIGYVVPFLGTLLQQANEDQEVDESGGNDNEPTEESEGLMSQGEGESFGFEQLHD